MKNNANFPGGIRLLATWLFGLAAMVAAMVLLGGLTRLTGSGLSMVEWNPQHLLPPLSEAEWRDTFAGYQATPQYRLVNQGMDLAGFQRIFWLEYLHRLWGRLIGVAVLLPLAGFALKGMVDRRLGLRLLAIFALGAFQGGLGWLMVASGLVDRPEVSHLRLAAHLVTAFVILGALLWTALEVAIPAATDAGQGRKAIAAALVLVLLTVTWGGMVAGLKAGLVYNTFPLMGGSLLPGDGFDIVFGHGAVQFTHRMLAITTVLALSALALRHRQKPLVLAAGWSWCQAGLGVATLLNFVPLPLAVAHQMGALGLFSLLVWALRRAGR